MDLKGDIGRNNLEENDGNSCDDSNKNGDRSSSSSSNNNNNNNNTDCVRYMREQHVIDAMDLLIPPVADSPLHILTAFCNELLYEVFMRLHFLDLLNVAKVCVRFQTQAHAVFAEKYKCLVLNHAECDQEKMESILSEFGSSIQSLQIISNNHAADGVMFRAIIQNCTAELKALKLCNVAIQVESPDIRLPFPNLEELTLCCCQGNINLAHLIDDCPEIKEIVVASEHLEGVNGLIDRKFEKLEKMLLSTFHGIISNDVLERFITLNPQLTELSIYKDFDFNTSRAIRLIGQNLLKLDTLCITIKIHDLKQSDIECIANLRSLKVLELNFNGLDITPLARALAKNNTQIQDWHIMNGSINELAIHYISQLKQLKTLFMCYVDNLNDQQFIGLVKNLPNLEELELLALNDALTINGLMQMLHHAKKLGDFKLSRALSRTEWNISMVEYNAMLDTIQNRPEKNGLRMEITSKRDQLNVPEEILEQYYDILFIECTLLPDPMNHN